MRMDYFGDGVVAGVAGAAANARGTRGASGALAAARAVAALNLARGTCAVAAPPVSHVWARVTSLKVTLGRPEGVTNCV